MLMITLQNYYNVISCEQSTWSRILGAINLSLSEAITWKKSKNEIKRLSDRTDAIRHQQADLSLVEAADKYAELEKEKATLEAEIARLREVHSQKLSKEAQNWWRCRFSAQLPKRAGWYGQAEEKCSRTGGCAPNDRTGPWNGPEEMTGFSKTAF